MADGLTKDPEGRMVWGMWYVWASLEQMPKRNSHSRKPLTTYPAGVTARGCRQSRKKAVTTESTERDVELMLLVQGGVADALGELFRRHHERVYAFCYRMLGDRAWAEDVCQDVFLRVIRFSHGYRGQAAFSTWVLRIARNSCLDALRRVERERDHLARSSVDPEVRVGDHEDTSEIARLHEALARLPPRDREVLVLGRYHDLSVAEIAEVCQASVAAVKVRIHRALRRLRDVYRALELEDHGLSDRTATDHGRRHG